MGIGGSIAEGAVIGITIKAIDDFSKTFDKASSGIGAIGKVASQAVAGVGIFAGAVVGLTKGFIDLGVAGSEVNDFTSEFNRLAGPQSVEVMNGMKEATLGAVTELELMNTSNKLMTSGISSNSLPMLADFATRLGETTDAFGGVSDIMQVVGTSIATGRFTQLEQMLGGVDLKGKSTAEILDIINQKMKDMPKPVADAGSGIAKLKATFEDMKNKLAASLEPAVMSILDKFQEFLPILEPLLQQFGQMGAILLEKLIPVIEKLIPYITKIITDYMPKLIDLFFKIFDALLPLLDPLFEMVDAILPILLELLDIVITDVGVDLIKLLADLLVMLTPIIKVLLEFLMNILKPIMPILNLLVQIIGVTLTAVLKLILPIIELFSNSWKKSAEQMQPVVDFLMKIVDGVKKAIDWIKKMPTSIGGFTFGSLFGNKQTGGTITETGQYLLHKGEEVIPKRNAESGGGLTIIISGNNYGIDGTDIANSLQKKLNKMVKY